MVTEKLKKKLMDEATKFLASERGQKLLQNQHFLQTLTGVVQLRGRIQRHVDEMFQGVQKALHLATREDLRQLGETLEDLRLKLDRLHEQTEALTEALARAKSGPAGGRKKRPD